MEDPLETVARYLETIREIDEADRELDRILKTVKKAGRTLPARWATVSVLGIQEPLIPNVPSGHARRAISPSQWPTLEQIASVLLRMHRAYDAAEAAWANVTPEFRSQLNSPPKRFPDDPVR